MTKKYRVWLQNEYFTEYPLFDTISEFELEKWLRENAECTRDFGKDNWWIDHSNSDKLHESIPYNSMGYLVKYEEI